jgi:hypothetical protein
MNRIWWIALLLVGGCQSKPPPAPAPPPPPSFRGEILPVFLRACAHADGCHGAKPTDSVDLDLRADAAWAQLVGRTAQARPGALRVKAGDPSASFLVDKLTGVLGPREGKKMPIDEITGAPIEPSPLPADFLAGALRRWIAAGAPNN